MTALMAGEVDMMFNGLVGGAARDKVGKGARIGGRR